MSLLRPGLSHFSLLILAASCLAPLPGQTRATTKATPTSDTVTLPEFTVTDSRLLPPPEDWRFTRIGGFDVLSEAPDKLTRDLLRNFQLFTQALALVWPAPARPVAASSLIICQRPGRFAEFLPASLGAARDDLTVSLLLRNREQFAIVADAGTEFVALDPTQALAANNATSVEYQVDHYRQLYREYVRFLISQSDTRVPVWLEEGLAQIVMDVQLDSRTLIYGKVDTLRGTASGGASADAEEGDATADATAVVGEQPFNVIFRTRRFIPFAQFFAVGPDAPEARTPLGNNRWAKQAYAFVHFCLFGEDLRHKENLVRLVQRLAREPLSEALFTECFGTNFAGMEKQLRAYILHVRHKYQRYDLRQSRIIAVHPIALAAATPGEVGLVKGDAYRLAGHDLRAVAEYRTAYLRGSRDPALLAALGAAEYARGNPSKAAELTDAAIAAETSRPSAYLTRARLRLDGARAAPGEAGGRLSPAQVTAVLEPLLQARRVPPELPETFLLMTEAWAASAAAPTPAELAVLDEGIRQFPRHADLLDAAVRLYVRAGASPTAASIARLGLRFASDDATRARFERLLAGLPPAEPPR